MEVGKYDTLSGQFVKVWRTDFSAIGTNVAPPHIVNHDQENIGAFQIITSITGSFGNLLA
jgi:hypothetical protein